MTLTVRFSITMLEKIDTSEELAVVIVKEYQHNSTIKGPCLQTNLGPSQRRSPGY